MHDISVDYLSADDLSADALIERTFSAWPETTRACTRTRYIYMYDANTKKLGSIPSLYFFASRNSPVRDGPKQHL